MTRKLPTRRRAPVSFSALELLERQVWWPRISEQARQQVLANTYEVQVAPGAALATQGDIHHHWYGVMEGLLKWSVDTQQGVTVTLGGIFPGSWSGEAGILRGRFMRANIVALRDSRVLCLRVETFHWLRQSEPAFNEHVLSLLAERVYYLMSNLAAHRLLDIDGLVARALLAMLDPVQNPLANTVFQVSQEELAHLATVSRQRCNMALKGLQEAGLIRTRYGTIEILDQDGLQRLAESASL